MSGPKLGVRVLGILGAAALAAGMALTVSGSAAEAAEAVEGVTCPTVSTSGVVTPAPTPGVDWDHCDLRDANLSSADLSGANLDYAIMTGANLSGASLTDATLYAAIFNSANLSSADFTGATMTAVYSGLVTASPAPTLPAGWQLIDGYLAGPGADLGDAGFGDANLSSADLAGAYLGAANLIGANLDGADLDGANVSAAALTDASLDNTNLTGAALAQVISGGITGTTTLLPADWQLKSGYLAGPQASLAYADAPGVDLSGTDLADASFYGADLSGADLDHANLTGVDATGTDLENANLTDVNLTDASIGGDAFGGGAATLEGADLAGAIMTGLGSGDIDGGPAALPPHWMFAGGYLLGPTAYLEYEGALQGLDLAGVDLASARVSSVEFQQDNLTNATFKGSDAVAGNFYEDTWANTICPDGNNSNLYVSGCFSARRYELTGFVAPKSGATLSKSARHFAAEFRLANPATGAAITGATARALAARHDVRAILAGPKIKTATVACGWNSKRKYFSCSFTTPRAAKTGKRYRYTITAQVNQGPGFLLALPARGVANPETIHFR
jgi:uncharacterized protein YjbI with pentapeptide repeats